MCLQLLHQTLCHTPDCSAVLTLRTRNRYCVAARPARRLGCCSEGLRNRTVPTRERDPQGLCRACRLQQRGTAEDEHPPPSPSSPPPPSKKSRTSGAGTQSDSKAERAKAAEKVMKRSLGRGVRRWRRPPHIFENVFARPLVKLEREAARERLAAARTRARNQKRAARSKKKGKKQETDEDEDEETESPESKSRGSQANETDTEDGDEPQEVEILAVESPEHSDGEASERHEADGAQPNTGDDVPPYLRAQRLYRHFFDGPGSLETNPYGFPSVRPATVVAVISAPPPSAPGTPATSSDVSSRFPATSTSSGASSGFPPPSTPSGPRSASSHPYASSSTLVVTTSSSSSGRSRGRPGNHHPGAWENSEGGEDAAANDSPSLRRRASK
ncbi:hypothetical protein GGS23DRAFT_612269 [Durotheca rogersii]|uniref:uncharacterized protein n=1 Tax=Durotheca rogersii TaxID=419775 RepID=UPI0022205914|nr:uncharacterized protein GGS23DRAFT_612269 [Durotheca rogersii]KAI5867170.1 hypothetical protein GGS23DRAFT_612269 [Durotheca rogersii]